MKAKEFYTDMSVRVLKKNRDKYKQAAKKEHISQAEWVRIACEEKLVRDKKH